jgi:ATP-dependent Clp protease adaptor protein ClpS
MSNIDHDSDVVVKDRIKVKKPSLFKVIIHNDDYTTMEFVVYILTTVFSKSEDEATQIMLGVHKKGTGICGVFTHEIAETKQYKVMTLAKSEGQPLMCTIEEE